MSTDPLPIAVLEVSLTDAWACHDALAAALAGFGGRADNAEPWHATNLMGKLRPLLLAGGPGTLLLTAGELVCLDYNIPRNLYAGAADLLLRVFHAIEEISYGMRITPTDPEADPERRARLGAWRDGLDHSETERG